MALTPTTPKNAITGKNTLVAYRLADQTPEAEFVTIPGVSVFTTPGGTVEDVDQTCIAEAAKRYLAGAFDGNEVTITIHHANAGSVVDVQIEYQDGTTLTMEMALKSAYPQEVSLSETIKWDVVGKMSGKPTIVFGS